MKRRLTAFITASVMCAAAVPLHVAIYAENNDGVWKPNPIRVAEELDRGLVAMMTDKGVYLSWRMYADEDNVYGTGKSNTTYDIYRDGKPLAYDIDVTNYIDPKGTINSEYQVIRSYGDITKAEKVKPFTSGSNYFDIALDKPADVKLADGNTYSYTANDASCGDLDGDGEYEIIVKWDCNGKDNSQDGYTGNVYLDAYKLNGTKLWRIDLGQNIRAGAHYTQFLVYDFDGDGKAEVTSQTAAGSKGGDNNYVTKTSHVASIKAYTDTENQVKNVGANGRILTGDEFLTIFDGTTGKATDTIYYPNQRVAVKTWGDKDEGYGNRCDRFTADVAYLDGEKPYAVYMRGYYMRQSGGNSERQAACGVSFDGEKLECKYSFDTYDVNNYADKTSSSSYFSDGTYKGVDGYRSGNGIYVGEGNHNCTVADVDNDGKDEVMTGALCYEVTDGDYLGVKWCTFKEHGDAMHIGDYDPTHDGYEFFAVHEDGKGITKIPDDATDEEKEKIEADNALIIAGPDGITGTDDDYGYVQGNAQKAGKYVVCNFGMSLIDAATGEIMFHEGASGDTGRGIMANIGPDMGYYQFWSNGNSVRIANGGTSFAASLISKPSMNFRIFWDGDLYEELLDGAGNDNDVSVTSWNGSSMSEIFRTDGCATCNGTKKTPCLTADLFGDWREEIVVRHKDNSALRVYTTNIYTLYKMKSLMYDKVYRSGVAAEQTAYNQPPHIGYYIDPINAPKATPIPEAEASTIYEKGTNSDTAWAESDINGWKQSGDIPLTYGTVADKNFTGLIYNTKPTSSYSASKSFSTSDKADTLSYDVDWFFGSQSGSTGNSYEYIQFGDNLRFGWDKNYNVLLSTDGGNTYSETALANYGNKTQIKNIKLTVDLSTGEIQSLMFDSKELTSYKGTKITNPKTISFGLAQSGRAATWNVPVGINKLVVSEKQEQETVAITPRPVIIPDPNATATPQVTGTPTVTITPTVTATPKVTETPQVTATPTATPINTSKPSSIIVYNKTSKAAEFTSSVSVENATVIFAAYNNDGVLVDIDIKNNEAITEGSNSINANNGFNDAGEVRVFIWNSLTDMKPINI